MNKKITSLIAAFSLSVGVVAVQAKSYDFNDPKGVNNISFALDAPLEAISGNGNGIRGKVQFDPATPEKTAGTIVLKTDSLRVTNSSMQEHMLSDAWLDAAAHPEITFVSKKLQNIVPGESGFTADLAGELTLKGVTEAMTVPVRVTHLPGKLADRSNGKMQGDLLVLRATFSINRSAFGIKPGQATDKVAEEIQIRLALAGAAPQS